MAAAIGWGALAASSLVIGALIGSARRWPDRVVGLVLGFGAGALISAVSFELALEGFNRGGAASLGAGLAAGGLTYYALDGLIDRRTRSGRGHRRRLAQNGAGGGLALGAFLDGIPEQLVLGLGLGNGETASLGLLAAVFVSNLPEAIGGAAGQSRAESMRLWGAVALVCTLASGIGYAIADSVGEDLHAGASGFAAGALIVMLVDTMIPEALHRARRPTGLAAVLGFALAAYLSAAT